MTSRGNSESPSPRELEDVPKPTIALPVVRTSAAARQLLTGYNAKIFFALKEKEEVSKGSGHQISGS